eukprot:6353807-Pyramimonas_sp.AAC.1
MAAPRPARSQPGLCWCVRCPRDAWTRGPLERSCAHRGPEVPPRRPKLVQDGLQGASKTAKMV